MTNRALLLTLVLAAGTNPAVGSTLALFDGLSNLFNGGALPSSLDPSVESDMTDMLGVLAPGMPGSDWRYFQQVESTSINQAVANGDFTTFWIRPKPGFRIELTQLSFDVSINAITSDFAVAQVYATWGINGFNVEQPLTAGSAVDTTINDVVGARTTISVALSQTVHSLLEFRLYHAASEQFIYLDNFRLEGSVVPVTGDFDLDGDVDGADFVAWQTNFPKPSGATRAQGDADGDFDVDGADFVVWQTNFPTTPVTPVPEPSVFCSASFGILMGLTALGVRSRR
jgi:hypothetical protein